MLMFHNSSPPMYCYSYRDDHLYSTSRQKASRSPSIAGHNILEIRSISNSVPYLHVQKPTFLFLFYRSVCQSTTQSADIRTCLTSLFLRKSKVLQLYPQALSAIKLQPAMKEPRRTRFTELISADSI